MFERRLLPGVFLFLPILALLTAGMVTVSTVRADDEPGWEPLYRGSLDDFRIYFRGQGYIEDVNEQKVFVAKPDGIHVVKGTNGLIVTKVPHRSYHVKVDYRWGAEGGSKNAGLMTHVDLESKLVKDNRPRSIEINMKQDCPGAVFLGSGLGPFASSFIKEGGKKDRVYLPESDGGIAHDATPFGDRVVFARYPEGKMNTRAYGEWNTLEAIVRGSESVEIILNGVVVNRLTNIRDVKPGTKEAGEPLAEGGIGLQSEGQEIFYRNFVVRKLEP